MPRAKKPRCAGVDGQECKKFPQPDDDLCRRCRHWVEHPELPRTTRGHLPTGNDRRRIVTVAQLRRLMQLGAIEYTVVPFGTANTPHLGFDEADRLLQEAVALGLWRPKTIREEG